MSCPEYSPIIVSRSTVTPSHKSTLQTLKLSVSDLHMLNRQYIQKGCLFTLPSLPTDSLIPLLKHSLSLALTHFPPLAGRLITDTAGFVHINCNDAGVEFTHANASHLSLSSLLSPTDIPPSFKQFFSFNGTISYDGHCKPIAAVQVTELADGVFIGCTVNHAVIDGTSLWNFFNSFAEICREGKRITKSPDLDFTRNFVTDSPAVLKFPDGAPKVIFDVNAQLRERIFHFSRESVLKLKARANGKKFLDSKQSNDGGKKTSVVSLPRVEVDAQAEAAQVVDWTVQISSFQSLSAQLWRSITRAWKLAPTKLTTFRMIINCRHRLEPKLHPYYFGNATQSIPRVAPAGELLCRELNWSAGLLHGNVVAHDDAKVRSGVDEWEKNPRLSLLGNVDGASITMGSSPRFPMYDNDFGWGRPVAVRSGMTNKFDGKISAFPGREGGGSVDLEVCLAPEAMAGLESDTEFMQYVSVE